MLKKFLWFFPLRYGAFTVASTAVVVSAVSMVKDFECLSTAAVSQGNLAFRMFYFISSILLLVATKDVSCSRISCFVIIAQNLSEKLPNHGALVDSSSNRSSWFTLQFLHPANKFPWSLSVGLGPRDVLLDCRLLALQETQTISSHGSADSSELIPSNQQA